MLSFIIKQNRNFFLLISCTLVIFFVLSIISKAIVKTTINYQEKINNKIINCQNKILPEQIKIIVIQLILMILTQTITVLIPLNNLKLHLNFLFINLLPLLSINFLLQLFICFSFLNKNSKNIKLWNNIRAWLIILLISIFILESLIVFTKFYSLSLNKTEQILFLPLIYLTSFYGFYRIFNKNFLIIKLLVSKSYKILIFKTNKNINNYINNQTLTTEISKKQLINNLWDFNLNNNLIKETKSEKNKGNNILIFLIFSLRNIFSKYIIKNEKIVINGWTIKNLK